MKKGMQRFENEGVEQAVSFGRETSSCKVSYYFGSALLIVWLIVLQSSSYSKVVEYNTCYNEKVIIRFWLFI